MKKVNAIISVSLILFSILLYSCAPNQSALENITTTEDSNNIQNHSVNINESVIECNSDADCVHAPVCCHRNAAVCVPKYKVNEDALNNCQGVFCTTECRPCTTCSCINHKCVTEKLEGGCC
ncbi:MAG: hypothetical protein PWP03_103 [Candidatus Woesearchaeota archaeon]|nr:hypothetical protein [Candidatus Woesearchaeota archaeon]